MRCVFAFCCARAATDHVAETVIPLMKSRRRIACPEAQDHANDPDYIRDLPQEKWGSEAWLHGSKLELRISALGQKQTLTSAWAMSALPPKADMSGLRLLPCKLTLKPISRAVKPCCNHQCVGVVLRLEGGNATTRFH